MKSNRTLSRPHHQYLALAATAILLSLLASSSASAADGESERSYAPPFQAPPDATGSADPLCRGECRDVCIMGAGIGGMSVAVFLKDRGYNPIVLESADEIGGSCDTVTFPAPPGQQNWVDIGVIAFPNTTHLNLEGFGPWSIDSVAFFERFGAKPVPIPISNAIPQYYVDLRDGSIPIPPPVDPVAFVDALTRYLGILEGTYPWMNTLVTRPDPIPAELLVTFDQFVAANNLSALGPLFRVYFGGGTTNLSDITAFDGIRMATNIVGMAGVINQGPNSLPTTFAVDGGCIQLYYGMEDYLGHKNVITNAHVVSAVRPHHAHERTPIELKGVVSDGRHKGKPFSYRCGKLVVAFPPLLRKLKFMHPDARECKVFGPVDHYNYYISAIDVEGPIAEDKDFVLTNYWPERVDGWPEMPTFVSMFRGLTYGPAVAAMSSRDRIPNERMGAIAKRQLRNVPPEYLTSVEFNREIDYHLYTPFYPPKYLATAPDAFTQLERLQGHRKTYYSSSLNTEPGHAAIINWAQGFVAEHFPAKH